jgi:predicted dehydrogenase
MKVAVIGLGRWGPRLIPKLFNHSLIDGVYGYDSDESIRARIAREFPDVIVAPDYGSILDDGRIGAVIVATPVASHYQLARQAMEHDKHVLLEKPLTSCINDARMLVDLASSRDLRFMVDHITVYSGVMRRLKELIAKKELGKILYFDAIRTNLGMLQYDVNVVWDLAIHEFAVLDYLMDEMPVAVTGVGSAYHGSQEEIAYVTMFFKGGIIAHVHVSWISPVRTRSLIIGGTKKMIVFDDTLSIEKLRLFDSGVDVSAAVESKMPSVVYRKSDARVIKYEQNEPMIAMLDEFFKSIVEHRDPMTDGVVGMRMVRILTAVEQSMEKQSARIVLD